jgi:hypothetical protein
MEDVTNAELSTLIPESVALVSPLLVRVTSKLSVWSVSISPNRNEDGEQASCGVLAETIVGIEITSTMANVNEWVKGKESGRKMDWGSRIASILKAEAGKKQIPMVQKPPVRGGQFQIRISRNGSSLKDGIDHGPFEARFAGRNGIFFRSAAETLPFN